MTLSDETTTMRVQWFMSPVCPTSRSISSPSRLTPVNAVEMLMNRSGQSSQSVSLLDSYFIAYLLRCLMMIKPLWLNANKQNI